ncbi:secretin N-terminal domain-containing protein [Halopseudomonas bauzanensis]|uniref:Type II/III secretion system short domain-containing protein n=1 Tax=Halopseudomonas bauzanensis TaxID=653930 RepID=A0A1H9W8Y6_9GAMM|nr:secretin N-terminal domain-containing protein [Halopseudomonas bauzanensis]SES30390.1 type II/III secretion system short domain-containing protein [Halopseudomonas bauzanensis]SFM30226.1 type II/III secretion system short domain-containing protein [Halopseudomonas bauzanensis]
MNLRIMLAIFTSLALAFSSVQLLAAPRTEVIPLGYNMAQDVIPAIQPMLRADERVSAYGNQLIIRAEPERLQEIRALLSELDRQPAKLRITVSNSASSRGNESGYRLDGRLETGAGDIVVGQPRGANQARVIRRETRGAGDGTRVITANEGYPVLIQTGQRIPLTSTTTNIYGQVINQTEYHDVTSGFYATVRLNGDLATITLSANNDRLHPAGKDVIDVQRTDTVVTARLGEWVTVGGVDDAESRQDRGLGRRTTTRSAQQQSIRLMVERLQ